MYPRKTFFPKSRIGDFMKAVSIVSVWITILLASLYGVGRMTIYRESSHRVRVASTLGIPSDAKSSLGYSIGNTETSPGIPVLCYHYVRGKTTVLQFARVVGAVVLNLPLLDDKGVWTHSAFALDHQLAYLHRKGYESVSLADLDAWRRGQRELPRRSVVITFDDGDRSVLEHARPILERYHFTATIFAVTGRVGEDWQSVNGMTWDELRELAESGVFTIESHTHDLHYKVNTPEGNLPVILAASKGYVTMPDGRDWREALLHDLETSRRLIDQNLGHESRYLAWPYGHGNAEVDSIARAAGFDAVCTLTAGENPRMSDTAEIKRYTLSARTSLDVFRSWFLN